jgi:hypothetical protein
VYDMNDDKLTLYYYKDGLTKDERLEVTNALAADAALAARYHSLCASLASMSDATPEALPGDMMERFHATIDRAAAIDRGREETPARPVHMLSFFWGAAITAALAVGIGIGVWFGGTETASPDAGVPSVVELAPESQAVPVVFQRSVQNYLRESERDIANLPVDAEADRLMLIVRLIEQNRLFEKAATQHNSADLARVLRAFEPILVELASDDISPEDAEALRAKLAFELNVMLTKLSRDASDGRETPTERT